MLEVSRHWHKSPSPATGGNQLILWRRPNLWRYGCAAAQTSEHVPDRPGMQGKIKSQRDNIPGRSEITFQLAYLLGWGQRPGLGGSTQRPPAALLPGTS